MTTFHLHDQVTTPDGRGLVQGWLRNGDDSITHVLCSHAVKPNPHLVGRIRGIWYLGAYLPEQLKMYWDKGE
jgi:hypothetical protein